MQSDLQKQLQKSFCSSHSSSSSNQIQKLIFNSDSLNPTSLSKLYQYFLLLTSQVNLTNNSSQGNFLDNQNDQHIKIILNLLRPYEMPIKFVNEQMSLQQKDQIQIAQKQIFKRIAEYQKQHNQKLEQCLLKSKRFQKTQSFTTKLIIDKMQPTNNYEVVKMEIQLLSYKTQIFVLNQLQNSPLLSKADVSACGTFGYIYFINYLNQEIAVKSIPLIREKIKLAKIDVQNSAFIKTLTEYFFILIFSQLQVGPKAKTIGGFDMIVHKNSIQFATQICLNYKDQCMQQISENIWKMHMLNVVHKDIKPTNMMYSSTFKKNLLIDFGCSEAITEPLGEKTFTKFTGTTAYCSDEILALLKQKQGSVDLYYNDIFGFKKSLLTKSPSRLNFEDKKPINLDTAVFELYTLKYCMYKEDYKRLKEVWKLTINKFPYQIEELQIEAMKFMQQVKPTQGLRQFYWDQISDSVKEMKQFQQINKLYRIKNANFWPQSSYYLERRSSHSQIIHKYSLLNLQYLLPFQKSVEQTLLSKQSLEKYFININENLDFQLPFCGLSQRIHQIRQNHEFIKFCIAVANFSSMSHNRYNVTYQDKIKSCKIALTYFQNQFPNQFKKSQQKIQQKNQNFSHLYRFFHFYILYILNRLPLKYKEKQMINSITTLSMLGFSLREQTQTVINILITEYTQFAGSDLSNREQNQQIYGSISKHVFLWEILLIMLIFESSYHSYPKVKIKNDDNNKMQKSKSLLNFDQINFSQQKGDSLIFVSSQFYYHLFQNIVSLTQNILDKLQCILMQHFQQVIKLENSSERKLWLLLCIYLGLHMHELNVSKSQRILKRIGTNMIEENWSIKQSFFPYLVHHMIQRKLTQQTNLRLLKKLDEIVNCKQISIRFHIQNRMIEAFKKNDFKTLVLIEQIYRNEVKRNSDSQQAIYVLKQNLMCIDRFLINDYLMNIPTLTKQSFSILSNAYPIIDLSMQIASNYVHQIQSHNSFIQPQWNLESINLFEKILIQIKLIRSFFFYLLKINHLYQSLSSQNISSNPNCLIISFKLKYPYLFKFLGTNYIQIEMINKLFRSINQKKEIQQLIANNLKFLNMMVEIFMFSKNSIQQIQSTAIMLQNLSCNISLPNLQIQQSANKSPQILNVIFGYFQITMFQTNFNRFHCQKIIQFYNIFYNNNNFSPFLKKIGLIRQLLNCYVYTNIGNKTIVNFLIKITDYLYTSSSKDTLYRINQEIDTFLWCQCKTCFPRPIENWNHQSLTLSFLESLNFVKPSECPYMALVYFYSMKNKKLQTILVKKFVIFILKSMPYLTMAARNLMIGDMHYYVYRAYEFEDREKFLKNREKEGLNADKYYPKEDMHKRIHRRFLHSFALRIKHGLNRLDTVEYLVQKMLMKEIYFEGYHFPSFVKKLLLKNLQKYFQVKENYKVDQRIIELLNNRNPFFH